jgi:formylglycine-generating enzyme required for sulfatase activity
VNARKALAILLAPIAFGTLTCNRAAPQALIFIDTDAPVPQLVDRLRISILSDLRGAPCADCVRDLTPTTRADWPVSFGVLRPADGSRRFLRVQLYPSGRESDHQPSAATAVDVVAEIRFDDSVLTQDLFVPFDCASYPPNLAAATTCVSATQTSAPIAGTAAHRANAPTTVGSWNASYARGCAGRPTTGTPYADERCIEGGRFWMGDYRDQSSVPGTSTPEHAVVVPPFFLDVDEYTVGRFRAALAAGYNLAVPIARSNPNNVPETSLNRCGSALCGRCCCTYLGPDDPTNDALPLNCLTAIAAEGLCEFEHRRLPREAEWEWAAGSRDREWLEPWGDAAPGCGDLVGLALPPPWDPARTCGVIDARSPAPVGTTVLDHTIDGIADMAGNVSEWAADSFEFYDEGCWRPGNYGPDPWCDPMPPSPDPVYGESIRGTSFLPPPSISPTVVARTFDDGTAARVTHTGFRCARPDS